MKTLAVILGSLLIVGAMSAQEEPIRIGAILPLSGPTSNFGIQTLRGINVAIQTTNDLGGIKGRMLSLVVRDNAGDPALTAREITDLIDNSGVTAVIGPVTTTNSAAAGAVCQQKQVPLVLPTATSPYVTEIGEYVSRICFTDPFQSKALAHFSRQNLRSERVAVIHVRNSSYSEKLTEYYVSLFEEMGGHVIFNTSFEQNSNELLSLVDAAMEQKPDLIFLPMYYPEAAIVINHLAETGKSVTLLGSDGWESSELFNLTTNYSGRIFISSHFSLQFLTQSGSSFASDFQQMHGDAPNALSALGYDAAMVLADALRRATVMTSQGVQQALATTCDYHGATGSICINEKRNAIKDVFILKALENKFVYETIISSF